MTLLETDMDRIATKYHSVLNEKYSVGLLNENQRLLKQYALIESAAKQWLQNNNWAVDDLLEDLQKYFLEVCISNMFEILQALRGKEETAEDEKDSSAEAKLAKKLNGLSEREFLSQVSILY
jgi:hypothetical protein